MKRLAVFASGTGSNFEAIADAIQTGHLKAKLVLLVSDRPRAAVVAKAKARGIPTFTFQARNHVDKASYEQAILDQLHLFAVDFIALAGYMRLIGPTILTAFPRRIVNIHPSLLPKYKGLDAIGQAMADGAQTTGVTIHYVDAGMDTGEVIAQRELDLSNLHSRDEIEQRIHAIEHELYPSTLHQLLEEIS